MNVQPPRSNGLVVVGRDGRQLHLEGRRRVRERRRVEDEQRGRAADVDLVVAGAAVDDRLDRRARAEDPDPVRAARAVDLDALDAREPGHAAGACDVRVGDDEVVADRRADHDERVGAGAAVDLHGRVLHVLVAVHARAAEERREVRDVRRVERILAKRDEGLEQERVVAVAAREVEARAVVVDLERVVLAPADRVERAGVAVRHVLGVGDRHAVGELEGAVARVRDERHGADGQMVVAAAEIDDRRDGGVVGEHGVVAAERVDRDALDLAVRDVRRGRALRVDDSDPEGAAARRVEAHVVAVRRAEDDELVVARAAARVDDVDPRVVARDDRDHVALRRAAERRVGRVAAVVEGRVTLPRRDRAGDAADVDGVVAVVDDDRVVRRAAREDRRLEEAVEVLDGGARGVVVAVGQAVAEVRVVVGRHVRPDVGLADVARVGEARRVVVRAELPDDEGVLEERHVEVEVLDERVDVAGAGQAAVGERVEPWPAGEAVAAGAAVQRVGERRADEHVVAGGSLEADCDQVGEDGRGAVAAERARVDPVVARTAVDDELVALGPDLLRDEDGGVADVHDPDVGHAIVDRVDRAHREAVGSAVVAEDRDRVAGVVGRDVHDRLLHEAVRVVRVGDQLELARRRDDLAGVDRDERHVGADERVDRDLVGAGREVDVHLFEADAGDLAGCRPSAAPTRCVSRRTRSSGCRCRSTR